MSHRMIYAIASIALVSTFRVHAAPPPGYTFTKLLDTDTAIPDWNGENFIGFSPFSLSDGKVVFRGSDQFHTFGTGIYEADGDGVRTIVNLNTPVPGGSGNFDSFAFSKAADNDGNTIAFFGQGGGNRGVFSWFDNTLGVIADRNTPAPGGGTFAFGAGGPSIENRNVLFVAQKSESHNGLYRNDNGTIGLVADNATPIPDGQGNFKTFRDWKLEANVSSFIGLDNANKTGIYSAAPNQDLQRILDTNSDALPGQGTFTDFGSLSLDGNDLAFVARTQNASLGIYTLIDGNLSLVANSDTPIPGGNGDSFELVGTPALVGGSVIFQDLITSALYTDLGGTLQRILGPGDVIDGRSVSGALFYETARDGNQFAVALQYEDFSSAIYLVTVPVPPSGAIGAVGAALAARRPRR